MKRRQDVIHADAALPKEGRGLPTKFFSFDSSKLAIKKVYDEMFLSDGVDWVISKASEKHHLTICSSHVKMAIEKGNSLDMITAYWSNLEHCVISWPQEEETSSTSSWTLRRKDCHQ